MVATVPVAVPVAAVEASKPGRSRWMIRKKHPPFHCGRICNINYL